MKDIEFLKEVNDRIVLSVDEPIYQSTERFITTMSEQLDLTAQQIKEALDFPYLAKRQRLLARPLIEAFVQTHPYVEGTPYDVYAQELLQAHPGIHAAMIEDYLQQGTTKDPDAGVPVENERAKALAPQPKQMEEPRPENNTETPSAALAKGETADVKESWKKLARQLRICGKVLFWLCAVIGCFLGLSALIGFFSSGMIYYYGASYALSLLLGQLTSAAFVLFGGYIGTLVLHALACLLDQGDPQIPFHHYE